MRKFHTNTHKDPVTDTRNPYMYSKTFQQPQQTGKRTLRERRPGRSYMMTSTTSPSLRVAVAEWVPWTKVTQANTSLSIAGPMANLLFILASRLGFEYKLVTTPDGVWGAPDANGTWNGLLGLLQRQEVEASLGPFGVTHQREQVCDFSYPFHSVNMAILMIRPTMQSDVAGFLLPFTYVV
ncbi:probable glutamate receptor [Scylla paramamosain]|uniref:probable glutamate receptor n=1 Tax=Scylla paramamosain TaxID=85552 RepID=UPI0030827957